MIRTELTGVEFGDMEVIIEYFRLRQGEYTHRQYELFLEIIEYYSKDKLKDTIIKRL